MASNRELPQDLGVAEEASAMEENIGKRCTTDLRLGSKTSINPQQILILLRSMCPVPFPSLGPPKARGRA